MKRHFRVKVVSVFLAGIVFSMFALTLLSNVLLRPVFISSSKKTMLEYADVINKSLKSDKDEIQLLLEEMNVSYGITSHIINEKCKALYSYNKMKNSPSNRYKYGRWLSLYEKKDDSENYFLREITDDTDNINKIVFISKTDDNYYIILNKSIKGIEQDTKIVSIFLMIMGITVSVVGTVIWSVFTRKFTDNIEEMSRITQRMSELDFSEKINLSSSDEIGNLASSIDVLSEKLELSIGGLKEDIERQKRLVRDISHELKTPVTTVKGYIENIQTLSSDNEMLKGYCEIAAEECDVIDNLVEEMLEMSRLESQGYICDMESVSSKLIENSIGSKLSVEFREQVFTLDFDKAQITCNSVLIIRAVMNFVKNAVKYGDAGNVIDITGRIKNDTYVFSVANKGKPISDDEKDNIWDLFYKNDKSRQRNKSHGIGLSMVRQIAVLHGGFVGLDYIDGKNVFSATIPIGEKPGSDV